jgi:hypothetical protein
MDAVAEALIVKVIVLTASVHPEAAPAVRVRFTVPAVISAALGVYVGFNVVAFGENEPVPLLVHSRLVWKEALAPLRVYAGEPAHTLALPPAEANG